MSNVIRFMELLGAAAPVGNLASERYLAVLDQLEIVGESRRALLDRDVQAICDLENARPKMVCMIATPDGAEEQDIPEQQDDAPDAGEEKEEK